MANGALSPAIQRLRTFKKRSPIWPEGTRQPLTPHLARYFFDLVSTCDSSIRQLLHDHPELPSFYSLRHWRERVPWFKEAWNSAFKERADFLAEKCADLANSADPKTAHIVRVKFDIYRWLAAKFNPERYGDKPLHAPIQTVNVGVAIAPERLKELRTRLDQTRDVLKLPVKTTRQRSGHLSRTYDKTVMNGAKPAVEAQS